MRLHYYPWLAAVALGILVAASGADARAADAVLAHARSAVPQHFSTPDDAVRALVAAVRSGDTRSIYRVLGPGSGRLIRSGDPVADKQGRNRFLAAYATRSQIEPDGDANATLFIGDNEWPFPFPLRRGPGGWTFDTKAGAEEILNRRIGRNELSAIQVCLAYVDAQREYALTEGNRNGLHEYAMRLVSSPGKKDGLYWPTKEGEPLSPFGPLAAKAQGEGYGKKKNATNEPYHGYFYKILTGQAGDAPGGATSYIVKGKLIGGFALVAYPARWEASGVMTFIVNHDGVVFQKNLGKATTATVSRMSGFDPDATWSKAQAP